MFKDKSACIIGMGTPQVTLRDDSEPDKFQTFNLNLDRKIHRV